MTRRLFSILILPLLATAIAACGDGVGDGATEGEPPVDYVRGDDARPVPPVLEITQGKPVNLEEYAVKGKYTLFDFFSPFCPPCVKIKPQVEALPSRNAMIVVRVVNINRPGHNGIDWSSPAAKQHQIKSVPQFKVYGPDQKLLHEGRAASQWLAEQ